MRYIVVIGGFWVFAAVAYIVMSWAIPALYTGSPSPGSLNYGTSFVVPFSRALAPWLAGVILVLGPLSALRAAVDDYVRERRPGTRRQS